MYILLDPKYLINKGIKYFDTISDGRAVVSINMIKVLGSMKNIDIITSMAELAQIEADYQNSLKK